MSFAVDGGQETKRRILRRYPPEGFPLLSQVSFELDGHQPSVWTSGITSQWLCLSFAGVAHHAHCDPMKRRWSATWHVATWQPRSVKRQMLYSTATKSSIPLQRTTHQCDNPHGNPHMQPNPPLRLCIIIPTHRTSILLQPPLLLTQPPPQILIPRHNKRIRLDI